MVAFNAPSYGELARHTHYGATAPIVATGITVDPVTGGYYVLTSVGGVHAFHAPWRGSPYRRGGPWAKAQAAAISVSPDGKAYVVVGADGRVASFGLRGGPARDLVVYVAENVTPVVHVGELVGPATVLGWVHDAGTCLETGWANLSDPAQRAAAWTEYTGKNSTAYGRNFSAPLAALGARPGLVQPDGAPGPLPATWPPW